MIGQRRRPVLLRDALSDLVSEMRRAEREPRCRECGDTTILEFFDMYGDLERVEICPCSYPDELEWEGSRWR